MIIIVSVFVQRDIFNLSSESGRHRVIYQLKHCSAHEFIKRCIESIEAKDNKDEYVRL